jgi:hypothetical protein
LYGNLSSYWLANFYLMKRNPPKFFVSRIPNPPVEDLKTSVERSNHVIYMRMRSSLVRMRSSLVRMRSSLARMRSSLVRMRSSLVADEI